MTKWLLLLVGVLLTFLGAATLYMGWMPGKSFDGVRPALSAADLALRTRLEGHVRVLAERIGPRKDTLPGTLSETAGYLTQILADAGFTVQRETFPESRDPNRFPDEFANIWVEVPGAALPDEKVVIGAHYDSADEDCPGANDNASGVALLHAGT